MQEVAGIVGESLRSPSPVWTDGLQPPSTPPPSSKKRTLSVSSFSHTLDQ
jgi:hypothetical protein